MLELETFRRLSRHIPENAHICHLFCKAGFAIVLLKFSKYSGFDGDPISVSTAKKLYSELQNVEFACVDITSFSPSERYDVVIITNEFIETEESAEVAYKRLSKLWEADKYIVIYGSEFMVCEPEQREDSKYG